MNETRLTNRRHAGAAMSKRQNLRLAVVSFTTFQRS